MRISLRDVDSKIPNLALMKISAYHKAKGDAVGFNLHNPDKIYTSIIFTKNKGKSLNQSLSDGIKFEFGGSGINYKWLPDEIERIKPDYDLYPSEYSQGFTSRGCDRDCYFCIVPDKEGGFKTWQHPREFHDDRFKEIMLMDNNILLSKEWARTVLEWCIDHNLKVNMTQGYDIRLLDHDIGDLILQTNADMFRFAFDDTKLETVVRSKIDLLKDIGFNLRNDVAFYCYCHDDSMFEDTLYRCNVLKNLGTSAHVMFNCDMPRSQRIKNLKFLERCYKLGKPFALLLPLTTFETRKRQELFEKYGVQVIFFDKRMEFEVPNPKQKGSKAWFATAWFTNWLNLPKELNFVKFEHPNQKKL